MNKRYMIIKTILSNQDLIIGRIEDDGFNDCIINGWGIDYKKYLDLCKEKELIEIDSINLARIKYNNYLESL